jgi:hypothetical protein
MTGGFAPRFVLELAFLALLALAAGLAELDAPWIVAIMLVGWLLVVAIEWLAWRAEHGEQEARVTEPEPVADDDAADWQPEDILAPLPEED